MCWTASRLPLMAAPAAGSGPSEAPEGISDGASVPTSTCPPVWTPVARSRSTSSRLPPLDPSFINADREVPRTRPPEDPVARAAED